MAETILKAMVSDEEFYRREFIERPVNLVCPEHGINEPWLPSTARYLWNHGYSDQECFTLLREATRTVKHRSILDAEITRAIELIVGTPCDLSKSRNGQGARAVYQPKVLEECAARIPDTIDNAYLEIRSQYTCWNRTPAGFLHKIQRQNEKVWITTNSHSSRGLI